MSGDVLNGSTRLGSALQLVGTFGPPLTVTTALLVYFGWARSAEQARALGFDESVLRLSTSDYVLRSIPSLFVPLVVAAAVVLAALAAHRRLLVATTRGSPARTLGALRVAGRAGLAVCVLTAGLVLVRRWPGPDDLVAPLVIATGVLLSAYAARTSARLVEQDSSARGGPLHPTATGSALASLLVGAIVALMLFWWTSAFAGVVGRGYAEQVARQLGDQPRVVVWSAKRLLLEGPGVTETAFADERAAYPFRYAGLRFLDASGGWYVLLPERYTLSDGTVILLPEEEVRLDFTRRPE